jgi:hypothetical protein
MEKVFEYF